MHSPYYELVIAHLANEPLTVVAIMAAVIYIHSHPPV